MRLIKASYQILDQEPGIEGVYKAIERAGRVCYKSEDNITETSAKEFVDRMIKSLHHAVLEHGTVYMFVPFIEGNVLYRIATKYFNNAYSKVVIRNEDLFLDKNGYYITTNYRTLINNEWLDDLQYLCEPTEYHEKRYTVKFIADAGVMREFFRHRVFSMAQESTRYCNYSKGKFNSELTFIIPPWSKIPENLDTKELIKLEEMLPINSFENRFFYNCVCAESAYLELINLGYKPQQARCVLPLSIKAEGIMTGFASDWKHFFNLRTSFIAETGTPHPQASELADPLYLEFKDKGWI